MSQEALQDYRTIGDLPLNLRTSPAIYAGSVFWCTIKPRADAEGKIDKSELNGDRTCALMGPFPIGRILARLKVPVVPLSLNLQQIGGVICRDPQSDFFALTSKAITIDFDEINLGQFVRKLSRRSMSIITRSINNTFQPVRSIPHRAWNLPGTILDVSWQNEVGSQRVAVIGLSHVYDRVVPMLVTPVSDMDNIFPKSPIEIYSLSKERAREAAFCGSLSMGKLLKLQQAARMAFGLRI